MHLFVVVHESVNLNSNETEFYHGCRCPSGFGSPGPNLPADMDPPTELSENIILNVLVEIDNTLHFSAYYSMFLIQNMRIADACELAARNDPSAPLADLDRWGPNPL